MKADAVITCSGECFYTFAILLFLVFDIIMLMTQASLPCMDQFNYKFVEYL